MKGLLGADALMADIQTFTYDLITSQAGKPQPVRQTISLASRYPFAFETQFRTSGVLEFETRMEDFDLAHPGAYARASRPSRSSSTASCPPPGSPARCRTRECPSTGPRRASWVDRTTSGAKYRVQPEETLLLSDYAIRQDALLTTNSPRMLRVFQGAGVASTWRLDVPRGSNDLDFGALTDVRVTFYYQARFDPELARSGPRPAGGSAWCAPRQGPRPAAAVALPRRLLPVPRHRQPAHPPRRRRLPGQRGRPDS